MAYYTGTIQAVPTANRQAFVDHAAAAWPLFHAHGATRMIETWGTDVPHGTVTDFYRAVEATGDESVVFSWIEWPDRATADAAWPAIDADPAMKALPPMPFDGSRMIFGGFAPVLERGSHSGAPHYQGFLLAVPEGKKSAYVDMAEWGWSIFKPHGALGVVEAWGEDVPHGKRTDFYRAIRAEEGEVPVFSWIAWPDRATCLAAGAAMEAEMSEAEMPEMPFDGMRMMWGGFEPVFDSGA
ncbi:DUF1428 domain-containing protein [Citreimonas sp.]|uniref:DUF1428 domain-containing protein n=1 Tax=Citreimonas sp. TaxID=3036715 RepID=UPI0035C7BD43